MVNLYEVFDPDSLSFMYQSIIRLSDENNISDCVLDILTKERHSDLVLPLCGLVYFRIEDLFGGER